MTSFSDNKEPLKEEAENNKSQEYKEEINEYIKIINKTIDKLIIDRNNSDKIIGLVIGTEISCFLTLLTDTLGYTEINSSYSSFRIILLAASILIRNINITNNLDRKATIEKLIDLKNIILSENEWLNEPDNQKKL